MTSGDSQFTVTTLVAAASEILEGAGFKVVNASATGTWRATEARVYEDAFCIVCIAVYETWKDLWSLWADDQATLVGLISKHFSRTDAKAWDGYLVLLTPSVVPTAARHDAVAVQRNTVHVRKLFGSGDELQTVDAVRRTLLPLLPLEGDQALQQWNVLDNLPPVLARHGVDEAASQVAITAFREQRSIIEEIHSSISKIAE